jgi:hypothetical protein
VQLFCCFCYFYVFLLCTKLNHISTHWRQKKMVIFPMGPVYGGGWLCVKLSRLQRFVFLTRAAWKWGWMWRPGRMIHTQGKPNYLNKDRLHCHLLHHKSHVDINIYYTPHNQHRPQYKNARVMLCKEVVTIHCENHTKRVLTVAVHQNATSLVSSLLKWTVRRPVKCKPKLFQYE